MESQNKEISKFCLERGFLVENDFLNLFDGENDINLLKLIINKIVNYTNQKVLTKNLFKQNKEEMNNFFLSLPKQNQEKINKLKTKLFFDLKIPKQIKKNQKEINNFEEDIKIFSNTSKNYEKIEVKNFTNYFRERFNQMKLILQEHPKLDNLVSINRIFGVKQKVSIIGIVYKKSITKNKNIILEVEDITGKIKILISKSNPELYKIAEEISLDSVLGFKGFGNNKILFVNEIIFPDSTISKRKKSPVEEYVLFAGDLHFGSKKFLKKGFLKFIDYLKNNNSNNSEVSKIKYLFLVGDLVTGVGNYPNQEQDLKIIDLEEQFIQLAILLNKIPKHIKIIISPGNHDGIRLMEPQPIFDEKYAWPLFQMKNVIFTENPCFLNIGAKENFSGFNILTYHGFSFFYYVNNIARLMKEKAAQTPEIIMKYLLKNRHLAPTHGSNQYYPYEEDKLLIKKVPDIFVAGHTHKSGISYHNNILVVSISTWEAMTPYMEKVGSKPDFCKVPMFNLKTRQIKILDFEENE